MKTIKTITELDPIQDQELLDGFSELEGISMDDFHILDQELFTIQEEMSIQKYDVI